MRNLFIYILISTIFCGVGNHLFADIVGITWDDSRLVSFDPYSGALSLEHTQLNPYENFKALTYDSNRNKLFSLSQIDWNLYSIDANTLDIQLIGKLNIDQWLSWGEDIGGLTYDPVTDTLYATVEHFGSSCTDLWSELVEINGSEVISIGTITNGFVHSLSYSEIDNQIYGYAVYGCGSWDSPYKTYMVRINPDDATMTTLFETPYHTIYSLAQKPGEDIYYSWVNWTTHFFGEVDLYTQSITQLGNADPVGNPLAMVYLDFYISPFPDSDIDGIPNVEDNCPVDYNPEQDDQDLDGRGDVCDDNIDNDNDGVDDVLDNCPNTPNGFDSGTCTIGSIGQFCLSNESCGTGGYCSMNQEDTDEDGLGDVCDSRPNEPGFDRYVSTTGSDTGNCGNSASPCASIQYAFDQALNGDIIKVSQGTYYENISINFEPMEDPLDMILIIQGGWTNDFKARNDDPSLTIIDGAGETVFEMLTSCSVGGLFVDLTIEGFTITNGSNGFYAVNEECLTKITFVNNIITVNSDTGVTSHSYYGVMTIEIINNNISGNSNGVYIDSRGTAILRDNFIADNNGFGLVMVSQEINEYVTGILINNVIVNNNASGIYAIADSLFFAAETRVLLMNNTIVGNNYEYGGGIYARSIGWALTNVDIINTIVWGNSATVSGNDIYLRAAQGDEGIVVINASFSDIGNVVNDLTYPGIYNDLGNNINVDPFFANPANGDYHVTASSQCIDAGTNDNAPLNDLDRETRPFDGDGDATATTDIGADEFVDTDTDSLADYIDNCLLTPNGPYGGTCTIGETYKIGRPCMGDEECEIDGFCSMNQEDSYGYGIGDACYVCEGNFNCDQDVDGGDAYLFKSDFGRSTLQNPCTNIELCNGDFLCDGDVDGADAFTFKRDFGRSQFHYPCPACAIGVWCVYP